MPDGQLALFEETRSGPRVMVDTEGGSPEEIGLAWYRKQFAPVVDGGVPMPSPLQEALDRLVPRNESCCVQRWIQTTEGLRPVKFFCKRWWACRVCLDFVVTVLMGRIQRALDANGGHVYYVEIEDRLAYGPVWDTTQRWLREHDSGADCYIKQGRALWLSKDPGPRLEATVLTSVPTRAELERVFLLLTARGSRRSGRLGQPPKKASGDGGKSDDPTTSVIVDAITVDAFGWLVKQFNETVVEDISIDWTSATSVERSLGCRMDALKTHLDGEGTEWKPAGRSRIRISLLESWLYQKTDVSERVQEAAEALDLPQGWQMALV